MEVHTYFYIFYLFFIKTLNRPGLSLEAGDAMECLAVLCSGSSYLPAESLGEKTMQTNPRLWIYNTNTWKTLLASSLMISEEYIINT